MYVDDHQYSVLVNSHSQRKQTGKSNIYIYTGNKLSPRWPSVCKGYTVIKLSNLIES